MGENKSQAPAKNEQFEQDRLYVNESLILSKSNLKELAANAVRGKKVTADFFDFEEYKGVPVRFFILGSRLIDSLNEGEKAAGVKKRAVEVYSLEEDDTFIIADVVFSNAGMFMIQQQTKNENAVNPTQPILVEALFKELKGAKGREYKNISVTEMVAG